MDIQPYLYHIKALVQVFPVSLDNEPYLYGVKASVQVGCNV